MKTTKNKTTRVAGARSPVRLAGGKKNGALVPVLSMAQAVRYTGRSYSLLYRHAVEGLIECKQATAGTRMFFTMQALNDYMNRPKQVRPSAKRKGH